MPRDRAQGPPPTRHPQPTSLSRVSGRAFTGGSVVGDGAVGLALAPALVPSGLETRPSFVHGFATQLQLLGRGLVTLADVTATR